MLIKYYALDGSLTIIDSITDVRVPKNPDFDSYMADNDWDVFDFDGKDSDRNPVALKGITYAHNGPCLLKVWGIAYICNDSGKTIEQVTGPGIPPKED